MFLRFCASPPGCWALILSLVDRAARETAREHVGATMNASVRLAQATTESATSVGALIFARALQCQNLARSLVRHDRWTLTVAVRARSSSATSEARPRAEAMVQTRDAKRVIAERQHPLYHSGTVELICAYVGPGHWAFKAPINKLWLQSYRKVPVKNKARFIQDRRTIQMTHFEQASAAVNTLKYALDYGLNWEYWSMFAAIGKCADKEVLTAAFKMGMPKHQNLNIGAAEAGDLAKLKFLEGCKFHDETFAAAASAGSIPVLEYLLGQEKVTIWNGWLGEAAESGHLHVLQWAAQDEEFHLDWNARNLCSSAAQSGRIEMMQFLQQQGADLSEHNISSDTPWADESITTMAARSELVKWLRQQGAEWPTTLTTENRHWRVYVHSVH
eukprot:13829-Heterococcus_DN1.PRE.5